MTTEEQSPDEQLPEDQLAALMALPVLDGPMPLFQHSYDGIFEDTEGRVWTTGWYRGVRYRQGISRSFL